MQVALPKGAVIDAALSALPATLGFVEAGPAVLANTRVSVLRGRGGPFRTASAVAAERLPLAVHPTARLPSKYAHRWCSAPLRTARRSCLASPSPCKKARESLVRGMRKHWTALSVYWRRGCTQLPTHGAHWVHTTPWAVALHAQQSSICMLHLEQVPPSSMNAP